MKKILLPFAILFTVSLSSQTLTLTKSFNEPVVGDTNRVHFLDTSFYANGLPNIAGSNVVWNFQNLVTTTAVISTPYVSTTAVSSASNYPGATFVQKQAGLNNFFKATTSPTTQTEFLGVYSTSISTNFTNTAIAAKFPFTYGNSYTDNYSGPFTFSVSGTANGNISNSADGTGTLNLPSGISFANVLRVKSVQSTTLISGFLPLGTLKQTTYNYYHSSEKFPILTINYSSFQQFGTTTPTVSGSATGHANHFIVGLNESISVVSNLLLFPNPASDKLHITTDSDFSSAEIFIYSQLGTIVLRKAYSSEIDISSLSSGIYLIEVKSDKVTARKKFTKIN
jgi:hypothetical protein